MTSTVAYNLLTADLFDCVPMQQIGSKDGQALIWYFEQRFKACFEEQVARIEEEKATMKIRLEQLRDANAPQSQIDMCIAEMSVLDWVLGN